MKTKRKSLASLLVLMMMSCVMIFCSSLTASADTVDEIRAATETAGNSAGVQYFLDTGGIESLLTEIQGSLTKIGLGIAGIAVIALAIVLIGGGSQGLQKGKGMAISIIVGVIVLGVGVSVVGAIADAAGA